MGLAIHVFAVEGIRGLCAADVARLVEIVQHYDPVPLIKTLYLKNGVLDAESYSEPTFEGSEAYVEYAQSLAVAVPHMGIAPPVESFDRDVSVSSSARAAVSASS